MTPGDPRRQLLLTLLQAALAAVDGRACTRAALGARREELRGAWLIAVGKAAASMTLGAHDALDGLIARTLILTKDGHALEAQALAGAEIHESGHPVPDERSLRSGARLLEWVEAAPADTPLLFLISGGASSLVEVLAAGVSFEDLRRLNEQAHAAGISIEELNARRCEISLVKGGRLTARLRGRRALALFVSDVPGDDPAVIGSGLLGPDPRGCDAVERVLLASIGGAMHAVQTRAQGLTVELAAGRIAQDAERLAVRLAHELHFSRVPLKVWGGESVVRLPPSPGRGGRNQHLALATARLIAGDERLMMLAVGTDGTDGPTDDAGALVDGDTCARVMLAGLEVEDCLRRADSATALAAAGDLVHTGPTGTNVGDLVIGLKLSEAEARSWLQTEGLAR